MASKHFVLQTATGKLFVFNDPLPTRVVMLKQEAGYNPYLSFYYADPALNFTATYDSDDELERDLGGLEAWFTRLGEARDD